MDIKGGGTCVERHLGFLNGVIFSVKIVQLHIRLPILHCFLLQQ